MADLSKELSKELSKDFAYCEDTISRKAAIDALFALYEYQRSFDPTEAADLVRQGIFLAEKKIEKLPSAQPEQRWIPCSERLPDVGHRVLLSGHGQVMVGMLHSFGKYSLEPTGISRGYPKDDIDAWMPLPEPWKKQERKV